MIRAILRRVREDVTAVYDADPAAKSRLEVVCCYPGLHAVWAHAVVHATWTAGFHLTARLTSQFVRFVTGVEIHPAAEIGRRVVIDHGMGVVIGETAIVGDDVHMYHGVTLGGNSPEPVKRHPTVEDGVTLGADATVLGDVRIGTGARVGAGAVVTDDVPAGATVAGIPAERVDEPAGTADDSTNTAETEPEDEGASETTVDDEPLTTDDAVEDSTTDSIDESSDGAGRSISSRPEESVPDTLPGVDEDGHPADDADLGADD